MTAAEPGLAVATSLSHLESTLPLLEQAGFQKIVVSPAIRNQWILLIDGWVYVVRGFLRVLRGGYPANRAFEWEATVDESGAAAAVPGPRKYASTLPFSDYPLTVCLYSFQLNCCIPTTADIVLYSPFA